jgi:hypothetical protein
MIELVMNDNVQAPAMREQPCPKCRGTGLYRAMYGGYVGTCNMCKGRKVVLVDGAKIASDDAKRDRRLQELGAKAAAWAAANPEANAWVHAQADAGNSFAQSMRNNLMVYGSLTPNMLAAVMRNVERAGQPAAAPPAASMPAVEEAFAKAMGAGIKRPKMRLGGFTVSPAPATGQNAGAIYVKSDAGVYLGKIIGGAFRRSRDCSNELESQVLEVAKDPKAAAIAYGKKYGVCSVCGRELSDPESVERGIGPICAERFGW